jgi:fructosamine-3-kinase
MFAGEAAGLRALRAGGTLVIPEVHFAGAAPEGCRDGNSAIVMDFLDFGARGDQAAFGAALAATHLAEPLDAEARAGRFGFPVDNTCGDTPQPNGWCDDWVTFFLEKRIAHQLALAGDASLSRLGERVCEKAPTWFEPFDASNPIRVSALHGDLWSGNIGTVGGEPSVFDPAAYYGHNEAEFGMSWCAGFSEAFYDAYFAAFPKTEARFEERRLLYRLYHYLNHYNLFGGGYKSQCVSIMNALLEA